MRRSSLLALFLSVLLVTAAHAKNIWRLTDINPGSQGSYPSYLEVFGDTLYFRANDVPSGNNVELWRWNGTMAEKAAEIQPGLTGSDPAYLTAYGAGLYFAASSDGTSPKMWRFDGTAASLAPGFAVGSAFPQGMTSYGGYLVYQESHFGADTELRRYDGAAQAPIYRVGGGNVLNPEFFCEYNGLLYFSAAGPAGGEELWRTNGSTAVQLTTILPPDGGSSPGNLAVFNGDLYFSAYDGAAGNELWRYSSATNTASLVADIRPGGPYVSGNPHDLCVYDGKLYFGANDGVHGDELWAYDGTNPPGMVAEINFTPDPLNGDDWMMDSSPRNLIVYEGVLYFTATDGSDPAEGQHGREIWSWDGTQAELEFDICPGQYGSEITEMILYGDSVFLDADDGASGRELWRMTMPEPATLVLLAAGTFGVIFTRRRRQA